MDDFRRVPRNRVKAPTARSAPVMPNDVARNRSVAPAQIPSPQPTPQPIAPNDTEKNGRRAKKPTKRHFVLWSLFALLAGFLLSLAGIALWYSLQLRPVNPASTTQQDVTIASGSTPKQIASQLKEKNLIRSDTAFLWYARVNKIQNSLQAGTYKLGQSKSTPEIAKKLSSGAVDTFSITFLPGATVAQNKKVFEDLGYSTSVVDAAFAKTYTSALFDGKPASADLEGYVYGETYSFVTGTSVETILERTFSEYLSAVKENNLVSRYAAHGLSLYEGITLASIVQKEASASGEDMPQIAQVFYKRLASDMPLGSDVTYQYIADKTGVKRDPSLDSPYNTRIYKGLPPGPIATPGLKALLAVASPASGDYLYFLSGDDDVTYFAKTLEEHEANIKNHCHEKCQIL